MNPASLDPASLAALCRLGYAALGVLVVLWTTWQARVVALRAIDHNLCISFRPGGPFRVGPADADDLVDLDEIIAREDEATAGTVIETGWGPEWLDRNGNLVQD